ncbi:ROK family protein [Mesoplasma syrphidae]|uniref:ROK family protein n=1 Tax=Mesoplasma syrphidae TaxID=225999 RepID=A0A2K9BNF6_9MOLU|nr:ROK family protein [Mesoplasma syrphidae]AUF83573.1 ROK family protein [Mesoplasma syrphidae]
MRKILGIDLGGTSAKVGIVNQFGELETSFIVKNDKSNLLENLAKKTINKIEQLGYNYDIDIERIGFACPGFINHEEGIVILSGNLNLQNFDIKTAIKSLFKKQEVYILNDVNAAALGEYWTGSASRYSSGIFYWLGTGIGGAIVSENKLLSGEHGFAGEFGHGGKMQTLFKCNCGLNYCIERTCSAVSFGKTFTKLVADNNLTSIAKLFKNPNDITMEEISKVYKENNKPQEIRVLIEEIYRPLFNHMAIMIQALDPALVVIGGGGSGMGTDLLEIIEENVKPLIVKIIRDQITFDLASLENCSGIIGAAYYAINNWDY